uniref:Uncharacterized protein n=1 Tax=Panagrolaimus sp. PS1159 TaxID=55785 RepID=A0AC35FA73_9BILA
MIFSAFGFTLIYDLYNTFKKVPATPEERDEMLRKAFFYVDVRNHGEKKFGVGDTALRRGVRA